MRTSKELLVASRHYAHEHRGRSWWHLTSTLLAFGACIALAAFGPWLALRIAAGLLAGLVYVRLFILYHDYQHGNILRRSKLAWLIMTLYGLVTLNPPSIWNRSHNHHHKHNAKLHGTGIGTYPLMTTAEYAAATPGKRRLYAITRHPLTMALGYVTVFLYGMCIRSLLANPKAHLDSALALFVHAVLLAAVFIYDWQTALTAVVLPSAVAAAVGAYLFYAQHNFPAARLQHHDDWDYVSAALESSSFLDTNRVMHWFTGNIGYHHVHHLNHRIPFYRLPEAMAEMPELQSPGKTSLHPREIFRCLRLKLYDTTANRLVGFKGA